MCSLASLTPPPSGRRTIPGKKHRGGSHPNTPQFYITFGDVNGGEGGIRTHVSFRENRFSRAAP
jgi:hypothetical protein